jgi:hypothetical protein
MQQRSFVELLLNIARCWTVVLAVVVVDVDVVVVVALSLLLRRLLAMVTVTTDDGFRRSPCRET